MCERKSGDSDESPASIVVTPTAVHALRMLQNLITVSLQMLLQRRCLLPVTEDFRQHPCDAQDKIRLGSAQFHHRSQIVNDVDSVSLV